MALLLKRPSIAKPPGFVAPTFGAGQLDKISTAWYFREGAGIIGGCGPNAVDIGLGTLMGWANTDLGVAIRNEGGSNDRSAAAPLIAPDFGSDQSWAILATPLNITGQDILLSGTSVQYLRIETNSNTEWRVTIHNGDAWTINHFATAGTPAIGRTALIAVTKDASNYAVIHVRDETGYYTGIASSANVAATAPGLYLSNFSGNGFGFNGYTHALWHYAKRLDRSHIEDLWANTWAPLERRIWVPVTAPSGPVTHTGTGALQAADAAVSGAGTHTQTHTGTGALQAADSAVSGIGERLLAGSGTLVSGPAAVSGIGERVHPGTGSLVAGDAAVNGVGEIIGITTGTGALQAADAAVSGVGIVARDGTGALEAAPAAVNGAGATQGLISGMGALLAADAAVSGVGDRTADGVGTLAAAAASVAGVGFYIEPGQTTLTFQDLLNIQDAVWAKLVNEGLVAKVEELWQRRGLDAANPQTYSKKDSEIRVGGITIDLEGDATEVTQTRRP